MPTITGLRPLSRTILVLAGTLIPVACANAPADLSQWPIAVVPTRDDPNRYVAVPPDCAPVPTTLPDSEPRPVPWHNGTLGFGCANAHNLAAMVEQPYDLLGGRMLGPADAEREAAAIQRYRQGKEKPLLRESTRGGTSGAQ